MDNGLGTNVGATTQHTLTVLPGLRVALPRPVSRSDPAGTIVSSFICERTSMTMAPAASPTDFMVMAENQYFTPDGKLTECKTSLEKNQEKKHMDLGSTVAKHPDDATIIGWAKATLGF